MPQRVEDCVVVLTGASSGLARAAAVAFARRGADVVLAARDGATLEEVARECERAGGRALVVPTDVTDESAVEALGARAAEAFGRIDVWINGAAVITFGQFEDVPTAAYRQVVDTNLFGQINGARTVLPYFRDQRRGVLINLGSVWGCVTSPYVSAYVVSKFAIRAFSESLQQALRLDPDAADIHVCTIVPQSVDTPIFAHAGNWTGTPVQPVPPVLRPDRVVRAILASVERPKPQRTVGVFGRVLELVHIVVPRLYSRIAPTAMNLGALPNEQRVRPTPGNLYQPMPRHNRVHGGWRRKRSALRNALHAVARRLARS